MTLTAAWRWDLARPKYWLVWLGFAFWYGLTLLPYRWQCWLGRRLGWYLHRFQRRRRQIAAANIAMCLPDLSTVEQHALVREVMNSTGIAFFETGMAWFWPAWRLDRSYTIEGLEHLDAAKRDGVGVILMAFHFTHIDIGAKLLGRSVRIDGTYRPHNNPVFDLVQRWGRERLTQNGQTIPRAAVRAMIKALRRGHCVWYSPDQDYGAKHSVFVPLFGIDAATVTATSELARLGNARVIPFTQTRKADGSGYHIHVRAPLEDFPSGDAVADAARINRVVEARIAEQPEQYLWLHRRFKTRPEGAPDLYQQHGVAPKRRRTGR